MIRLLDLAPSVNAYKVRLFLSLLQLPHETVAVDVMKGQHKSPEYLHGHPFGLVPVLIDGDETFWDSQGILVYLARRYGGDAWLPQDPAGQARVAAWLSVAANEVHNGPFQARVTKLFGMKLGVDLEVLQKRSNALLATLERHLANHDWLALDHVTIADIAVFPGIAQAHEGGIDLSAYPAVTAWVERVKRLPGYRSISGKGAGA